MKHDIKELLFNMFGYTDVDLRKNDWRAKRLLEASKEIEKLIRTKYEIRTRD